MSFRITNRLFTTSARTLQENPSLLKKAADTVKKAAQALKSDGSIGSKFEADGSVGGRIHEAVGGRGPLAADGSVGKQFRETGAVGGLGQTVAEKTEAAAKDVKRDPHGAKEDLKFEARKTAEKAGINTQQAAHNASKTAERKAADLNDASKNLGRKI
ncbi:hypothetical protein HKX48_005153 [Thoreauomyces humboldtii]|nr:hypothetical protein HKX48_005153 [Thoreauomyces humboldtii]